MDEQSGETEEEEVIGEVVGESVVHVSFRSKQQSCR